MLEGMTPERLAEVAGCSLDHAQRIIRGQRPAPRRLRAALYYLSGELGRVDAAWEGWTLREGVLVAPAARSFTPGELLATPYLEALQAELARLHRTPAQLLLALPEGPGSSRPPRGQPARPGPGHRGSAPRG